MIGTLTVSHPEPCSHFRTFRVEFADGAELQARGFVGDGASPRLGDIPLKVVQIRAKVTYGHSQLSFLVHGGDWIELHCADVPTILPAKSVTES